jgi:hypothetical protein
MKEAIKPLEVEQVIEHEEPQGVVFVDEELKKFTKDFSPLARAELSYKMRLARIKRELEIITKEDEVAQIQSLRDDFNTRFATQKERFTLEAEGVRDIETISREKNLIFVHTVPLTDVEQEANTQMNNDLVTTSMLTTEERIGNVVLEAPTIACSSVRLGESAEYGFDKKKMPTMYPFGVVITQGTVLSAYRFDGATKAISKTARQRKYDKAEVDTSIQPKIDAQLEYAVEGPFSKDYEEKFLKKHGGHIEGTMRYDSSDYNEFNIAEPTVSGFYIDADSLDSRKNIDPLDIYAEEERRHQDRMKERSWLSVKKMCATYPEVPIYIKRHNQVEQFLFENDTFVPLREQGKIERRVPTKTLDDYAWPTADHAVRTKPEQPVSIRTKALASLLQGHLNESGVVSPLEKILSYDSSTLEMTILLLENKNLSEDAVYDAIAEDFAREIEELRTSKGVVKLRMAESNDYGALNSDTGMYPVYTKQINAVKGILAGVAKAFEQKGLLGLAVRILKLNKV